MNNTPNGPNITLFLLIFSIVVAKFGFERLSDLGVWLVNLLCFCLVIIAVMCLCPTGPA
jgi:hypothetical protein